MEGPYLSVVWVVLPLTPPRKLKHASPVLITDAGLLEQLLLATNHNVVPGEGIEDVGPVKVMIESGIELDDVLYTLKGKIDRRAYLGNTTLRSWSEHWFVAAAAEAYGGRVMLPVIKEKLKAPASRPPEAPRERPCSSTPPRPCGQRNHTR